MGFGENSTTLNRRSSMPSKTVFVIEPDEYHRDIIHAALDHHGYRVVEVDHSEVPELGEERGPPDLLVVADLGPGGKRLILDWIRSHPEAAGIPILCVAEDVRPWHAEEAIEAGCTVVCLKPLDPSHFAVQVRQLIGPSIRKGERESG